MILLLAAFVLSCGDDDGGVKTSRNVKFEVSGNFSGSLDATYLTESGGGTTESIPSLTWTKTVNYASTVPSTSILVGGLGGSPGQAITVKVFAGGNLVSTTPGTATTDGVIVVSAPAYIF